MSVGGPQHREVHFWSDELTEPPCGTLEDRFEWSDAFEDVTCERCREVLAAEGVDLADRDAEGPEGDRPAG